MIRIGDLERSETSDRLSTHAAAGRLSIDELEQRLESVQGAVHARDLLAVEADLPSIALRRETRRRSLTSGWLRLGLIACVAVLAVATTVAVGHPIPPLLIAPVLLWRWTRRYPRARPVGFEQRRQP